MFHITVGQYTIGCQSKGLPVLYTSDRLHAVLAEEFDLHNPEGNVAFVSVKRRSGWPFLVVASRCIPGQYSGFYPGALLVPETDVLFLGFGERILAYDLARPARVWEDTADMGFWKWHRHGDIVLMSAELELAAWDIHARKLWSTFVEPPWEYSVDTGFVNLDVMGKISRFPLADGPRIES